MPINQNHIIKQLNKYLVSKQLPELDREGVCNGLVGLYLYKGPQWLKNILEKIGVQDSDKLDEVKEDIEKLIAAVNWLQYPYLYIPQIQQANLDSAIEMIAEQGVNSSNVSASNLPIQKEYSLSFVFYHDELEEAITTLIKDDRPVTLTSTEHIMGLMFRAGIYYLYDPNADTLELSFGNTVALKEELDKRFDIQSLYFPLTIDIYRNLEKNQLPGDYKLSPARYIEELLTTRSSSIPRISINSANKSKVTAICEAARNGNTEIVKILIDHGANVNQVTENGYTPLLIAAHNGYPDIVKALLSAGADPNQVTKDSEMTVLCAAARSGNIEAVQSILQVRSDKAFIDKKDKTGSTALCYAVRYGHLGIVKHLLQVDADPNNIDDDGESALFEALKNESPAIFHALVNRGADYQHETPDNLTLLHISAHYGYSDIVLDLIRKGLDIDAKNSNENTPLIFATQNKQNNVIEVLLENYANPNQANDLNSTPLHIASEEGYTYTVKKLLEKNAEVSIKDDVNEDTALHLAARKGHFEAVRLLLSYGADSSLKNLEGQDALDLAVSQGHLKIAKLLTSKGANISNIQQNIKEAEQELSEELEKSSAGDSDEVIKLLKELGCAYALIGNSNGALAAYQKVLKVQLDDVSSLLACGDLLMEIGSYQQAYQLFLQANKIKSNNFDILVELGNCSIKLNDFKNGVRHFKQALELAPNNISCLLDKGEAEYELGAYDAALKTLQEAVMLEPSNSNALNSLGLILAKVQRFEEAITQFQAAHTLSQDNEILGNYAIVTEEYAIALEQQGNKQEALKQLIESGRAFYHIGKLQESLEQFEYAANQIDAKNSEVLVNLSITFCQLKRPEDNLKYLERALQNGLDATELAVIFKALEQQQGSIDYAQQLQAKLQKTHFSSGPPVKKSWEEIASEHGVIQASGEHIHRHQVSNNRWSSAPGRGQQSFASDVSPTASSENKQLDSSKGFNSSSLPKSGL